MMYDVFNKTSRGYSHINNNKPCQDFSSLYKDNERIIITCCDGHGGAQYIRSQVGSKLAGDAVLNVFKDIDHKFLRDDEEKICENIKLLILCEYNKLIEREITNLPIRRKELEELDEDQIDAIRFNPAKAYGTTLTGAMVYKNKMIIVSIGDTETLGIKDGELIKIFDNSNDPAGNVTYSMCQEDAYQYLRVRIMSINDLDGIILCTDGLSSPFQSYDNFTKGFIKPMVNKVLTSKSTVVIEETIEDIASSLGVGDDVSLAFIINSHAKNKYYSN